MTDVITICNLIIAFVSLSFGWLGFCCARISKRSVGQAHHWANMAIQSKREVDAALRHLREF